MKYIIFLTFSIFGLSLSSSFSDYTPENRKKKIKIIEGYTQCLWEGCDVSELNDISKKKFEHLHQTSECIQNLISLRNKQYSNNNTLFLKENGTLDDLYTNIINKYDSLIDTIKKEDPTLEPYTRKLDKIANEYKRYTWESMMKMSCEERSKKFQDEIVNFTATEDVYKKQYSKILINIKEIKDEISGFVLEDKLNQGEIKKLRVGVNNKKDYRKLTHREIRQLKDEINKQLALTNYEYNILNTPVSVYNQFESDKEKLEKDIRQYQQKYYIFLKEFAKYEKNAYLSERINLIIEYKINSVLSNCDTLNTINKMYGAIKEPMNDNTYLNDKKYILDEFYCFVDMNKKPIEFIYDEIVQQLLLYKKEQYKECNKYYSYDDYLLFDKQLSKLTNEKDEVREDIKKLLIELKKLQEIEEVFVNNSSKKNIPTSTSNHLDRNKELLAHYKKNGEYKSYEDLAKEVNLTRRDDYKIYDMNHLNFTGPHSLQTIKDKYVTLGFLFNPSKSLLVLNIDEKMTFNEIMDIYIDEIRKTKRLNVEDKNIIFRQFKFYNAGLLIDDYSDNLSTYQVGKELKNKNIRLTDNVSQKTKSKYFIFPNLSLLGIKYRALDRKGNEFNMKQVVQN